MRARVIAVSDEYRHQKPKSLTLRVFLHNYTQYARDLISSSLSAVSWQLCKKPIIYSYLDFGVVKGSKRCENVALRRSAARWKGRRRAKSVEGWCLRQPGRTARRLADRADMEGRSARSRARRVASSEGRPAFRDRRPLRVLRNGRRRSAPHRPRLSFRLAGGGSVVRCRCPPVRYALRSDRWWTETRARGQPHRWGLAAAPGPVRPSASFGAPAAKAI